MLITAVVSYSFWWQNVDSMNKGSMDLLSSEFSMPSPVAGTEPLKTLREGMKTERVVVCGNECLLKVSLVTDTVLDAEGTA